VKRIVQAGHEIGCHGWSHELVYRQTREQFRKETRRAKGMLEDVGGAPVLGYRASTFSITQASLWALDILAEEGFAYDSSIAPLRHDRYGIPDERREPHVRDLAAGRQIVEFPVSTMRVLGLTFPLGGGFFRLFPLSSTSRALRRYERAGSSAMIYLHPWELDPDQPRAKGLRFTHRVRHYARLKSTEGKLIRLLERHSWGTMEAALAGLIATATA
jgi:polysaccharide deacetylase family protein (PEP-CTERM system associated)